MAGGSIKATDLWDRIPRQNTPRGPLGVNRVVSAMSAVSPLYPHEPTSSVRTNQVGKVPQPDSCTAAISSYSITSSALVSRRGGRTNPPD